MSCTFRNKHPTDKKKVITNMSTLYNQIHYTIHLEKYQTDVGIKILEKTD